MRGLRSLYLALFTLTASLGVVFALLASLQDDLGFATSTLGIIAAAAFFSSVVAQLWLAPLADRGHTRVLIIAAVVVAAAASLWFALATTVIELVLARLVAGIGIGAFQPAARAIVSSADPKRAGERLGRLAAVETAGFVSGPVLGAALNEVWGLDAPFIFLAIALILVVPGLARTRLPEIERPQVQSRLVVARAIIGRRQALAAILLGAALFLPAGMYEAIWARFLEDLGASTLFVGITLTMYGVPFAVTAAVAGRFIDRYGPWKAMRFALIIVVPLTIVYGQLTSPWLLLALAMVEAVGNGAGMPASQAAMAGSTSAGEQAAGQGLVAAAMQIGAGSAALLAAPLYAGPGPGVTFAAVALIAGVLGAIGLWLVRPVTASAAPGAGTNAASP
jgi:DHA1 family bicyclomycin/chloramphenicol resistance-like MFS transporter